MASPLAVEPLTESAAALRRLRLLIRTIYDAREVDYDTYVRLDEAGVAVEVGLAFEAEASRPPAAEAPHDCVAVEAELMRAEAGAVETLDVERLRSLLSEVTHNYTISHLDLTSTTGTLGTRIRSALSEYARLSRSDSTPESTEYEGLEAWDR